MNAVNQSIFQDLEIPTEKMLDDPDAFKELVFKAASQLERILDKDISIQEMFREFEKAADNKTVESQIPESIDDAITECYEFQETGEIHDVIRLQRQIAELSKAMEAAIYDRIKRNAAMENASLANKKIAHIQHRRLREAWDHFRKFVNSFYDKNYPAIRPKQGNYSSGLEDTIAFRLTNGDQYFNHRAASKALGIWYEGQKYADIIEYCERHPEEVELIRVPLK